MNDSFDWVGMIGYIKMRQTVDCNWNRLDRKCNEFGTTDRIFCWRKADNSKKRTADGGQ
jgi:hypothetical protein